MFFGGKSKNLAPPLSKAPPGPQPSPPSLFLGAFDWWVEKCGDLIRSDLTFSSNAKIMHQALEGKIEDLQLHILNFLPGEDLINLCKALDAGSVIVSESQLMSFEDLRNFFENGEREHSYRSVIITDQWFDVDSEYQPLANEIFCKLRQFYNKGCSVIIGGPMGVFSATTTISNLFDLEWSFASYTTKSMKKTRIGERILGDSFPFEVQYLKSNFIKAPPNESLFIEHINSEEYSDDSDYEFGPPEPSTDTPVAVHFREEGGSISYFGFVNSLDVSYGAMMLRLANATYHFNRDGLIEIGCCFAEEKFTSERSEDMLSMAMNLIAVLLRCIVSHFRHWRAT